MRSPFSDYEYIVRCYKRSKYFFDVCTFRSAFDAARECRVLSKRNPNFDFCYFKNKIKPNKNIDDKQLSFDF